MKRCYWYRVAESNSEEANCFRNQHPEIPFKKCQTGCTEYIGYTDCNFFTLDGNQHQKILYDEVGGLIL